MIATHPAPHPSTADPRTDAPLASTLASIARHLPDVLWRADRDGQYHAITSNVESLLGHSDQAMLRSGRRLWLDAALPAERPCLIEAFNMVLGGHPLFDFEYQVRHTDGSIRWVRERMWPSVDHPGSVDGLATDMTAARRDEGALEKHRTELASFSRLMLAGEFGAELAHELNQPLSAIANYVEACSNVLASTPGVDERVTRMLQRTGEEALRAGDIIRNLRSLVDKRPPTKVMTDLMPLLLRVVRITVPRARIEEIDLQMDIPPSLPKVPIAPIQIEQVMLNLVRNAIEATSHAARRQVTLHARVTENAVLLAVQDTGKGLNPGVLSSLFEPFVTTKPNGLGMGLHVCKCIVESHGGRITAINHPDGGARFEFSLPLS
jgi:C4-dicarboxylate-specific signal transduction histidine kinase